jgi:cysteine synthase A
MGRGVDPSVLSSIGQTPLVELARVGRGLNGRILAKLEYLNPGGSKKDRIALRMIEDAEASGSLQPGQTVVELTSGNTGTGLAVVCAVKGYPFVAVMSAGNSRERAQMMRALGAEVIVVGQGDGSLDGHVTGEDLALVEQVAARTATERGAFRADQFHLSGNASAHHDRTAAEIWAQSGGGVDMFCDFVGTGGTFAGVARFLKEQRQAITCRPIHHTASRAVATQWRTYRCWRTTLSTATSRSTTKKRWTPHDGLPGPRASWPDSQPEPVSPQQSSG